MSLTTHGGWAWPTPLFFVGVDISNWVDTIPTMPIESLTRTARLFHALSDETRLRILDLLRSRERCVCDLSVAIGAQQSRLSFHLRTLKEAGLVNDRRQGRWIYYGLRVEALEEMGVALRDFQDIEVTADATCCG